jgi:hypothetical protein
MDGDRFRAMLEQISSILRKADWQLALTSPLLLDRVEDE